MRNSGQEKAMHRVREPKLAPKAQETGELGWSVCQCHTVDGQLERAASIRPTQPAKIAIEAHLQSLGPNLVLLESKPQPQLDNGDWAAMAMGHLVVTFLRLRTPEYECRRSPRAC